VHPGPPRRRWSSTRIAPRWTARHCPAGQDSTGGVHLGVMPLAGPARSVVAGSPPSGGRDELSELGIGLTVLSIAALMDLPANSLEPYRQADRARLARQARRHWSGPAPGPGMSRRAGALGAAPGPRSTPWRRSCGSELEAAVLTSVTTCCRTTSGGEPPERAAARKAHRSARADLPATPSARCVPPVPPSHWSALRCWPTEARW